MTNSKMRKLREMLNKEVESLDTCNEKVLELSQQLDVLILEYLQKQIREKEKQHIPSEYYNGKNSC